MFEYGEILERFMLQRRIDADNLSQIETFLILYCPQELICITG